MNTHTALFETRPWSPGTHVRAPARSIIVEVTREHVNQAYWARFRDPISIALRDHLHPDASSDVFWNSDSFGPRYHDDDARISIYVEQTDPDTGRTTDARYHLPLPTRATRAMWKLRKQGVDTFQTLRMRVRIPTAALPPPQEPQVEGIL